MCDDLKNIGPARDGNALATVAVYLIGLAFGMVIMAGISHYRAVKPTLTYAPCGMCHKVPVLDTAKKYAEWHKATPAQRISLLVKWGRS